MKKSQPRDLEVKPLKKYREPRYPIAEDFDLTVLRAQPYPFSSRFRSWATTLGASSLICSLVSGEQPAAKEKGNPFTVATSGLPFRTSPYGTGQPSYLSQEQAREIIDKIFAEKGFKLQKDFDYRKDDIAFKATGFDAKARVGYVWGDWDSLDPADAIIRWMDGRFSKEQIEQLIEANQENSDNLKQNAENFVRVLERKDQEKKFETQIGEVKAIENIPDRLRAMAALFEKLKPQESDQKVSLREMSALEANVEKDREFVAVISQRQFSYHSGPTTPEMGKAWEAAMAIEDKEKRAEALKKLQEEAASATLKQLEESVRDYLEWARGQGLQN